MSGDVRKRGELDPSRGSDGSGKWVGASTPNGALGEGGTCGSISDGKHVVVAWEEAPIYLVG